MPVLRDHDGQIFIREWSGGLLSGGFESESRPVFDEGIPKGFEFQLLPENWEHFGGWFCKSFPLIDDKIASRLGHNVVDSRLKRY